MAVVGTARAPTDVRPSLTRAASTPIAGTLIRTGVRRAAGGAVVAGPPGAEAVLTAFGVDVGESDSIADGAVVIAEGEPPAIAIRLAAAQATPRVVSRRVAGPTRR
jgi:hypothetical protein